MSLNETNNNNNNNQFSDRQSRLIDFCINNISNTNTQINSILELLKINQQILNNLIQDDIFNNNNIRNNLSNNSNNNYINNQRHIPSYNLNNNQSNNTNNNLSNNYINNLRHIPSRNLNNNTSGNNASNNTSGNNQNNNLNHFFDNLLFSYFTNSLIPTQINSELLYNNPLSNLRQSNFFNRNDILSFNNRYNYPQIHIQRFNPNNLFNHNESDFLNPVIIRPSRQQINNAVETSEFSEITNPINTSCPITLSVFLPSSDVSKIKYCGHIFSKNELDNWFRENTKCPVCRYDIRDYNNSIQNNNISNNLNSNNFSSHNHNTESVLEQDNLDIPAHIETSILNLFNHNLNYNILNSNNSNEQNNNELDNDDISNKNNYDDNECDESDIDESDIEDIL